MDSIDYYERYANIYYENTVNIDMSEIMDKFVELLPENADVLDLGCGSGRDAIALEETGCYVTLLDGAAEMCKLAEIAADKDVLHMRFDEMEFEEVFDGIWACASLLHVSRKEIDQIMSKVCAALKPEGILYVSFQYGEKEEVRDGRLFSDYTPESLEEMLRRNRQFEILDIWITEDVRERKGKQWVNALVKKRKKEKRRQHDR